MFNPADFFIREEMDLLFSGCKNKVILRATNILLYFFEHGNYHIFRIITFACNIAVLMQL
jgi:hypothetical protein